ncbi:MAG: hypothetical protein AAFY72_01445 [Cyanobacteria bacterium J06649_4]
METLEFQAQVEDGIIKIPAIHQTQLSDGTQVKVIVLTRQNHWQLVESFKNLLEVTQALPQAQSITDEEIAAEIAAYRAGR